MTAPTEITQDDGKLHIPEQARFTLVQAPGLSNTVIDDLLKLLEAVSSNSSTGVHADARPTGAHFSNCSKNGDTITCGDATIT